MPEPDHKLNALGMLCPLPLLFAVRDMAELEPGQLLEIIGDDPGLLEDIPSWCQKAGHHLVGIDEDEGVIICRVQKREPGTDADEGAAEAGETPASA